MKTGFTINEDTTRNIYIEIRRLWVILQDEVNYISNIIQDTRKRSRKEVTQICPCSFQLNMDFVFELIVEYWNDIYVFISMVNFMLISLEQENTSDCWYLNICLLPEFRAQ